MLPPSDGIRTPHGSRVRVVRYGPGERHARHAHPYSTLTLIMTGGVAERVGPRAERGTALSVVLKPAGTEHEDAFGADGATTLQVVLSPEDERRALDSGAWDGAWRWAHAGSAARVLLRLCRAIRAGTGHDAGAIDGVLHEALATMGRPHSNEAVAAPNWLAAARRQLEGDSSRVSELAREAGVHRVYLARVFRRYYGAAPAGLRRRARARRAAALVVDGVQSLCESALEAGYADQAHMARELKRATGMTPSALRALAVGFERG